MKILFFVSGVLVFAILSCSSTKDLKGPFPKPTQAENYFNSSNALSEKAAKAMIERFPKHP
jgi:hypothetical protein